MNKYLKFLTNKDFRFCYLSRNGFYHSMPDEKFLKRMFKAHIGKELNLDNPQTFNEKLQWLKLYDRKPEYTTMVDKYEVKEYISKKIGEEYIIPTLGVWDKFDDIDFDSLPKQFVLKCTHDSGGLVICKNKATFNKDAAQKKINKCLKRNYFWNNREYPYKNVKPRIIAEQYLEDDLSSKQGLTDYKFFCFNGEPKFLYVSSGLENHKTAHISFLTLDWEFAPFQRSDYAPLDKLPPKPTNFDKMLETSSILSQNIPFVRVDLYEVNKTIRFSELTFSPCSGYMPFIDSKYDEILGDLLVLPKKTTS